MLSKYYTGVWTAFHTSNAHGEFLNELQQRSLHSSKVVVDVNDQILTLSTCGYRNEDRFVVHAKKIDGL